SDPRSDDSLGTSNEELRIPSALDPSEFVLPLDKASIRSLQPWVDNPTFELKWTSMQTSAIEFFGGARSSFHLHLALLPPARLPGHGVLCHGDPKFDNFGWTRVQGASVFSDNDFDDSGFCPVAADALRYLVATDLWFGDASLNVAALQAYVATVARL